MLYAMRHIWFICLFVLGAQTDASQALVLPAYSEGYDPARDPFADGRAALQLAKDTRRKVLIEIGGDWCSWCHVLDGFLSAHPELRIRLHQTFVLLKVNVDEANGNSEFLSVFPRPQGYPHMYITDTDGTILFFPGYCGVFTGWQVFGAALPGISRSLESNV
ncbi:MAG: thioredoxin family protein [Gammaproteobacteria bacterium]|nr:thioredoxin family protein [Gammaproteobacteria bacterium]